MNAIPRLLIAASLLAALAACGNKGPLVQADSPEAQGADGAAATTQTTPPASETEPSTTTETPVDTTSETPVETPVDETEPTPVDPVEPPVEDDGDP